MPKADGKYVAYASRAMTSAEQNYALIEKDILAISFATSKFHHCVYGKPKVSVQTKHKPLESTNTTTANVASTTLRPICTVRARKVYVSR